MFRSAYRAEGLLIDPLPLDQFLPLSQILEPKQKNWYLNTTIKEKNKKNNRGDFKDLRAPKYFLISGIRDIFGTFL